MSRQPLAEQPVVSLKGVGPQTARALTKLGIQTVQDILFHLPSRYEDRTRIHAIGSARPGQRIVVEGRIEQLHVVNGRRPALVCRLTDNSGQLTLRFFHFSAWHQSELERSRRLRCFGEIRSSYGGQEMIHPEFQRIDETEAGIVDGCLTPIYPTTEGVSQTTMRKLVNQALTRIEADAPQDPLPDWIPRALLARHHFPPLADAIRLLHAPPPDCGIGSADAPNHPARERLAFEELLAHHLSMTRLQAHVRTRQAPTLAPDPVIEHRFLAALPFRLTDAQQRVITEIQNDLASGSPMVRLLQGDVGCGKTVVAASAALTALASGFQVAVMAPTELLAEQHYRTFDGWLTPLQASVVCLTGRDKGRRRKEIESAIGSGAVGVIVGTHALFQESVTFPRLGLVIIDEQHRFGVHQRSALRAKGLRDGRYPHQLVMTATPIPRTLALLGFSSMTVSVIDERPPGRSPVQTRVIPSSRRHQVIERIAQWVRDGRQAYWVCTLIEESETLQCEAAERTQAILTEALPGARVGLLHGRMKAQEKASVMNAFIEREIDVLVATTVIEVGVDVPRAGLMVIENPERLGLSQLHQLRGRVGRGSQQSFCLLLYQAPLSTIGRQRLSVMRQSNDGFAIAEQDLELRGPGELLGTRQTGRIGFRVADLGRDNTLLPAVLEAGETLRRSRPECVEGLIRRWLGSAGDDIDV